MEAALRDWLLGCNPRGTTMIVGYPEGSNYPSEPHSSYYVHDKSLTWGGLVDGPIYNDLFKSRAGSALTRPDDNAVFNNGIAVYHDDYGDYSSNEPTMDGTAGLTYYFANKEGQGKKQKAEIAAKENKKSVEVVKDKWGAAIRVNPSEKNIYLVFTADSMFYSRIQDKKRIK